MVEPSMALTVGQHPTWRTRTGLAYYAVWNELGEVCFASVDINEVEREARRIVLRSTPSDVPSALYVLAGRGR